MAIPLFIVPSARRVVLERDNAFPSQPKLGIFELRQGKGHLFLKVFFPPNKFAIEKLGSIRLEIQIGCIVDGCSTGSVNFPAAAVPRLLPQCWYSSCLSAVLSLSMYRRCRYYWQASTIRLGVNVAAFLGHCYHCSLSLSLADNPCCFRK